MTYKNIKTSLLVLTIALASSALFIAIQPAQSVGAQADTTAGASEARDYCKKHFSSSRESRKYDSCVKRFIHGFSTKKCTGDYANNKGSKPTVKDQCEAGKKASAGKTTGTKDDKSGSSPKASGSAGGSSSGGSSGGESGSSAAETDDKESIPEASDPALDCAEGGDCDLIAKYLNPMISFLTAFVGIAVVIGIITGGIRYAAAGDDPQKIGVAKNHIKMATVALFMFLFLYAGLTWLLPATGA